jgi:nitrite reductase/ring-hydroxylating ferredoxin subunit
MGFNLANCFRNRSKIQWFVFQRSAKVRWQSKKREDFMMTNQRAIRELGSAYDLPTPSSDINLTSVTRGTPGGELLRRYWHPIAVASEVKDLPVAVRVLGEDLILFKSSSDRFGLVYPRCVHRGTTLYYGKVEESGIHCGYHGWLFDDEGNCLNQPCELNGGKQLEQYRQPWYPDSSIRKQPPQCLWLRRNSNKKLRRKRIHSTSSDLKQTPCLRAGIAWARTAHISIGSALLLLYVTQILSGGQIVQSIMKAK